MTDDARGCTIALPGLRPGELKIKNFFACKLEQTEWP